MQISNRLKPTKAVRLSSVKYRNRVIYINGDPFLNWHVPLCNEYSIDDIATWLVSACAEYDVVAESDKAQILARRLVTEILKDKRQLLGGFELGWN